MKKKSAWLERLVPYLIAAVYHILQRSIRWQVIGHEAYRHNLPARYLYAFWHARLLMIPRLTQGGWHGYMLISEHRDGGFIADTMRLLGVPTLRGSSTRGGARAMRQMIRAVQEEHCHLGITPDGPKGPRETVKKGTVQLAQKTGLPVVPLCYATSRYWRIDSWDRFYIPQPFSRGIFVVGEPVVVQADEDIEEARQRIQKAMDHVQQQADHFFMKT